MRRFDGSPTDQVRRAAGTALTVVLCLSPSLVFGEGFGPFPVRNFNPLQQLVLNMPGDRATVLPKGGLDVRLELAETAAVYSELPAGATAQVKFETLRSGLFLRYGATSRLEVAVEIPMLYRYTGFMSGMIEAVEKATTGLSPARSALSQVSYIYNVSRNGQQIVNGTNGALGLGDSMIQAKYQLLRESSFMPALSVRTAIKVPTGVEHEFLGSGSPDFGLGVAQEKEQSDRWVMQGNFNGVSPTGRNAGIAL